MDVYVVRPNELARPKFETFEYSTAALDPTGELDPASPRQLRADSVVVVKRPAAFVMYTGKREPVARLVGVFVTSDVVDELVGCGAEARACVDAAREKGCGKVGGSWRLGRTRKRGWQMTTGFYKKRGHNTHRRLPPELVGRMAALGVRLHAIEAAVSPAAAAARLEAGRLQDRPPDAGCIQGTATAALPASQMGISRGFSSELHTDRHVVGTAETIVWGRPTNRAIPNRFFISAINVVLDLTAADTTCLLLEAYLEHGTLCNVTWTAEGCVLDDHDGVGAVIATRPSMSWSGGWHVESRAV
jgi:hypothetical protein